MEIFEYIKQRTKNITKDGIQVKIDSNELIKAFNLNEQTIFSNLKRLEKSGLKHETYKVKRIQNGEEFIYTKRYFWVEY